MADVWQRFFNTMLSVGEVKQLAVSPDEQYVYVYLHEGANVVGMPPSARPGSPAFRVSIPSARVFEQHMKQAEQDLGVTLGEIPIVYMKSSQLSEAALGVLPVAVIFLAWFWLSKRMQAGGPAGGTRSSSQMGGMFSNNFGADKMVQPHRLPETRFSDVAGLGEAKVELNEFVEFLKTPEKFERLGAKTPKGALLTGPPGTGKTLLAKAVAGEAGVPFFSVAGSDFVEMFVGVGPSRVRDLFKAARASTPCIIYIDEIDAIARARSDAGSRSGGGNSERESTLNQLLVEMDGTSTASGCLVLASTNRTDILDKAVVRPGRFDRQIACDLPTLLERADIFKIHMRPLMVDTGIRESIPKRLASLTPGMSGAQISSVCNEAALKAARHQHASVTESDFEYAVDRVSNGLERASRIVSHHERNIVAVHECGHAVVAWFLTTMDPVIKLSLIPRAKSLGSTQYLPSEQHLYSKEQLLDRMASLLGGRAAEQVVLGNITTGAQDDLRRVTDLAYAQVTQYGMNAAVGPVIYRIPRSANEGKKKMSNAVMSTIDREVKQLVDSAFAIAVATVEQHKDKLVELAQELKSKELLTYDDVVRHLGARPAGAAVPESSAISLESVPVDDADAESKSKSESK